MYIIYFLVIQSCIRAGASASLSSSLHTNSFQLRIICETKNFIFEFNEYRR